MTMDPRQVIVDRRTFLNRATLLGGAVTLGGPTLLAACGDDDDGTSAASGTDTDETTPRVPQEFTIPIEDPASLLAGFGFDLGTTMISWLVWSGLYAFDADRQPIPADAASYEPSDDLKVHRFRLREDLRWSDGTPYGAEAYLYGARYRIAEGQVFNPPWLTGLIAVLFEGADVNTLGIEVEDEHTLVYRSDQTVPFMLNWVAGDYNFWPLPEHVIEPNGTDSINQADPFVGNGPYIVESRDSTELVFVRNPEWTGPSFNPEKFTTVIFPAMLDTPTFTAFQAGDLDLTTVGVPAEKAVVLGDPDLEARSTLVEVSNPWLIAVNHLSEPLGDVQVRKALYMAVDREALAETVLVAGALPAYLVLGPGLPGYAPDERPFESSADAARQLLADAGFPAGEGFPQFTYLGIGTAAGTLMIEAVIEMWREVLGIDVQLRRLDPATWLEATALGDQETWGDMCDAPFTEFFHDPADTFPDLYNFGGPVFHHNWQQPDALFALQQEALYEPDPELRAQKLTEYDKAVMAEVPVIPLVHNLDLQVRQEGIEGSFAVWGSLLSGMRYLSRS